MCKFIFLSFDLTATCETGFSTFPFDKLRCYIKLESCKCTEMFSTKYFYFLNFIFLQKRTDRYKVEDVKYIWESKNYTWIFYRRDMDQDWNEKFKIGDFNLLEDLTVQGWCLADDANELRPYVSFTFCRQPTRHLIALYLPAVVLVLFTWVPINDKIYYQRTHYLSALLIAFTIFWTGHWYSTANSSSTSYSSTLTFADHFLFHSLLLLFLALVDNAVFKNCYRLKTSSSSVSLTYNIVGHQKNGCDKRNNQTTAQKCWLIYRTYGLLPSAALIVYSYYFLKIFHKKGLNAVLAHFFPYREF